MIDQAKVRDVAGKLTANEALVLLQMHERFSIHPGNQGDFVRRFLRKAEIDLKLLTNPSFDNYYLTPLGLAVRAHLQGAQDGQQ